MAGRTGPISAAGKEKVAGNAVKHGLRSNQWMSPEERRDFDALAADLEAEYHPSTATQHNLVERIAMCTSKLRRLHTIEDALFHRARSEAIEPKFRFQPEEKTTNPDEDQASAMPNMK